jgi:RNA polymerase sigma factor (sigma-70 family)
MNKIPWQNKIGAFFTRERERMVGYVHRLIDDTAERDGEDIVQDVILNIFSKADVTIPIENLTAYVYQALRNRVIDYLRRKRKIVSLDEKVFEDEALTLSDILPDPRNDRMSEEFRLDIRERLFEALSGLGEEQRAIIIATEFEGRTFKVLSEAWGVPMGTLLARKSRALQKIREAFSDFNE